MTAEDIERTPSMPLEELLASKFPGVWISRTSDGGLAVRIRGTTTIIGNKEPLYILDGVSILAGPDGGLKGISPSDIESIEVVKDAAGMAMYGVRGANGVIIIKTKKPTH
ncbi:MAG: TonB-dependent receptor plug domain-containing protein [Gemmatimonadota bacterium]|nr:TonB-dependent receptor plug domain-containing protein [Gemmatimonadota bacterium]